MPCPLTEPDSYPDYLKKIIKEVEMGNDEDLKKCLCTLVKPLDDDNCYLLDEDKKIALFPGCLVKEEVYGQFFTLKEIMKLYWMTKTFTLSMKFTWSYYEGPTKNGSFGGTLSFVHYPVYVNGQMQPLRSKRNIEKVCPLGIYKGAVGELSIVPTPRKKVGQDLYSLDITGYGYEVQGSIVPVWQFSTGLNATGFTWGFDETGPEPISAIFELTANFYDGTSLKLA
jgi:hypothetical protein